MGKMKEFIESAYQYAIETGLDEDEAYQFVEDSVEFMKFHEKKEKEDAGKDQGIQ